MGFVQTSNTPNSGIGNSQVTNELVVEQITSGLPVRTNLESWVVWSSVPITQAGTNVNEGEVPLRMKYRQLLAVAPALALQAG